MENVHYANSGSITAFDEDRMIYPRVKGVGSSIDDYDNIGPGGYWENFGIGTGYSKKYFQHHWVKMYKV